MSRRIQASAETTRATRDRKPRLQMPADILREAVRHLTARDLRLLELVWEHRVFTTDQLTAVFFPSQRRARQRLTELHRLQLLDRFRPWTQVGTKPFHWVIGVGGAHVLAAQRGCDLKTLGYRRRSALDIAQSPLLTHQIGVNDFFTCLHAHAHLHSNKTALTQWWPEQRCAKRWGDLARPDAFAQWTEQGPGQALRKLEFFLEYDNGTEQLSRVTAKLGGYIALTRSTHSSIPVLFSFPTTDRETNFRRALTTPTIPLATTHRSPALAQDAPAGAIWLPAGTEHCRTRLADLAGLWPNSGRGAD